VLLVKRNALAATWTGLAVGLRAKISHGVLILIRTNMIEHRSLGISKLPPKTSRGRWDSQCALPRSGVRTLIMDLRPLFAVTNMIDHRTFEAVPVHPRLTRQFTQSPGSTIPYARCKYPLTVASATHTRELLLGRGKAAEQVY
jgi:hypothetical protein